MFGSAATAHDESLGEPVAGPAVSPVAVAALGNIARTVVTARRSLNVLKGRIGVTVENVSASSSRVLSDGKDALAKLDDRLGVSTRMDSAVEAVGANSVRAWADGKTALSAWDERLGLSRRINDADEKLGFSKQREKLLERVSSMDLSAGLIEHGKDVPGDSSGSSERPETSGLVEEFAKRVSDVRSKGEEYRQKAWMELNKAVVKTATSISQPRSVVSSLDPSALCYYDAKTLPGVAGCVALTIDDAPCHQPEAEQSLLPEVRDLLAEFNAQATFFLCTDFVRGHEDELRALLRDGHEVANHCAADRPYSGESELDFEAALLRSEDVCNSLREEAAAGLPVGTTAPGPNSMPAVASDFVAETSSNSVSEPKDEETLDQSASGSTAVAPSKEVPLLRAGQDMVLPPCPARWFRAPHADTSDEMRRVLQRHGFTNVLCDCFANDTVISDPSFIAEALLKLVNEDGGSIVVIHVPERGFREHNLQALRALLEGLRERQMRVMTVSALTEAAWAGGVRTPKL